MRPSLRVGLFLQALPSAPLVATCGISALSASKGFMNTSAIHESLTYAAKWTIVMAVTAALAGWNGNCLLTFSDRKVYTKI